MKKTFELLDQAWGHGERIIVELGLTQRIFVRGTCGAFDGSVIWEWVYQTGPRKGEVKQSYSLPFTYHSFMPNGRRVPAGRCAWGVRPQPYSKA